jgi:MFS superfamily sulfate permease-like transporter
MSQASHNGHPESLRDNVAELISDVGSLAELQWQLFTLDAQQAWQRALWPLVIVGAALGIALGTVPVLLLGIAQVLVELFEISTAVAYISVAVVFAIIAGVTAKIAIARLRTATESFRRSREELRHNVQWMQRVIQTRGRTERSPMMPGLGR